MNSVYFKIFFIYFIVCGVNNVVARHTHRIKRVSDSHFANLETQMALNTIRGIAITLPIGAGKANPKEIGRKRRSQSRFLDILFNQSEEDNGDPIPPQEYDYIPFRYNIDEE